MKRPSTRKLLTAFTAGLTMTAVGVAAHAQLGPPPQQPDQNQAPDDPFGPPPGDAPQQPADGFGPPPGDDPFAMPDPRDELADAPEPVDADEYDVVIGTIDLNAVNIAYAEYEMQRELATGPGNSPFGAFGDPFSNELIDDGMLEEIETRTSEIADEYDIDIITFNVLQNEADNVATVDLTRPVQESLLDDADEYAAQAREQAPDPFAPGEGAPPQNDPFGPPPGNGDAPQPDDPFGPPPGDAPQEPAPPQDDPFGPPPGNGDAPQQDDPFGPPPSF